MTDAAWQDTFDMWMSRVRAGLDRPIDPRVRSVAADVAEILLCEPAALPPALHRLGARMGDQGWDMEEAQRWLTLLEDLVDRGARRLLQSFAAQSALAEGWAREMVRGAGDARFVDPVSGVATTFVLRRRIEELAASPASTHCAVIVEPALGDIDALHRDGALALLGRLLGEVFDGDETVVRHRDRFIVLADDLPSTGWRALRLQQLAQDPASGIPGETIVWVDPLPAGGEPLREYARRLLA